MANGWGDEELRRRISEGQSTPEENGARQQLTAFARAHEFATGRGRSTTVARLGIVAAALVVLAVFMVVNFALLNARHQRPQAAATPRPLPSATPALVSPPSPPVTPTAVRHTYATPPARLGAAIAYDPELKAVVMFGGTFTGASGTTVPLGDTWVWDGKGWYELQPETAPPARSFGAMAFDPRSGNLVLFGGGAANADPLRNDTWLFNGTTWRPVNPRTSPPAMLAGARLAYDDPTQRMVLAGVHGSGTPPVDTWLWDGSDWLHLTVASNVPFRLDFGMAYDPELRELVLYGGHVGLGPQGYLRDTWTLSASGWTQLTPTAAPSGGATQVAFDPITQTLISVEESGTWGFDGKSWTKLTTAPPWAAWRALAADPDTDACVLFGGKGSSNATAETLVWTGARWS